MKNAGGGVSAGLTELGGPWRALTLRARAPGPLAARPKFHPLSEAAAGETVLQGRFEACGQSVDVGVDGHPWTMTLPSEGFARSLHRFDWLLDLAAIGERRAGLRARALTDAWTEVYGDWNSYAWQPDILRARLFAQLACWGAVLSGDQDTAPAKIAARRRALARQAARLKAVRRKTPPGLPRLKATSTLALAGAMLGDTALLDRNLDRLDDLLELQVLGDGCHISRRPIAGPEILQILLTLEDALKIRGIAGSKQTRRAIDRLAPTLAFFDMGDGGLACFNGSGEGVAKPLKLLAKAGGVSSAKPFGYMPHGGYQRVDMDAATLIMDTGGAPDRPYDRRAHLAPLAFELAVSGKRMIVNCGFNAAQPSGWRALVRETAAHSTLIIDDCSVGALVDSRAKLKAFGSAIDVAPGSSNSQRNEQDGDVWLEASHDSYIGTTGLVHNRRLYMSDGGADIRGEDTLSVPMGGVPKFKNADFPFAIRFHLHPDVRATLSRDANSALIILPGGEGWRFRTDSGPLSLEPSIYLGRGKKPARCEQIIIQGRALSDNDGQDKANRARWSIRRVPIET